jgi:hypothetical protein
VKFECNSTYPHAKPEDSHGDWPKHVAKRTSLKNIVVLDDYTQSIYLYIDDSCTMGMYCSNVKNVLYVLVDCQVAWLGWMYNTYQLLHIYIVTS